MRICSMRASRSPLRADTELRWISSAAAWRARAACCRASASYAPFARRAKASSTVAAPGTLVGGAPSSYSPASPRMVARSCFSSRLSAFSLSACSTCLRAGREGAEAGRPGLMRGAAAPLAFAAALFAARALVGRLALPAEGGPLGRAARAQAAMVGAPPPPTPPGRSSSSSYLPLMEDVWGSSYAALGSGSSSAGSSRSSAAMPPSTPPTGTGSAASRGLHVPAGTAEAGRAGMPPPVLLSGRRSVSSSRFSRSSHSSEKISARSYRAFRSPFASASGSMCERSISRTSAEMAPSTTSKFEAWSAAETGETMPAILPKSFLKRSTKSVESQSRIDHTLSLRPATTSTALMRSSTSFLASFADIALCTLPAVDRARLRRIGFGKADPR